MGEKKYNPVERAYNILLDVYLNDESTKEDYEIAAYSILGYLGEALDDHPEVDT